MIEFKYIGDVLHLSSMLLLLSQIIKKKSCMGVSYKTQEIFLVVFLCRYSELLFQPVSSYYLLSMKLLYITLTAWTIALMRFKKPYSMTYDQPHDNFPSYKTIYPITLLLTILFHITFTYHPIYSYIWSFSIILEAFAMIPQIYMIRRATEIEVFNNAFIVCLGSYRAFYVVSWVLKVMNSDQFTNNSATYLEIFFGTVQTILISDFIWRYFKAIKRAKTASVIPI